MGREARGDHRREVRAAARAERKALRLQAWDDQIFAAVLARYGGDEQTAALYWRLSRTVLANLSGPGKWGTVDEVLDYLADNYEPLTD